MTVSQFLDLALKVLGAATAMAAGVLGTLQLLGIKELEKTLRDVQLNKARIQVRTASLMHQSEPKSTEFPDRLDTLERLTLRNWCPGAESNHRHGDFQSL